MAQNEDGNFARHSDGRLAYEHQPRKTPIYSILCETEPCRSIVLAPLRGSLSDGTSLTNDHHAANSSLLTPAGYEDLEFGSRNPFRKPGSSTIGYNEHPQILLAIRLEKTELNIQAWRDWLRNLPAEGKDIKIDGIYQSFSTLLLLRMPVAVWNLLSDNPVYSFVGFVTSDNMVSTTSQVPVYHKENPKISTTVARDKPSFNYKPSLSHSSLSSGSGAYSVPSIPLPPMPVFPTQHKNYTTLVVSFYSPWLHPSFTLQCLPIIILTMSKEKANLTRIPPEQPQSSKPPEAVPGQPSRLIQISTSNTTPSLLQPSYIQY